MSKTRRNQVREIKNRFRTIRQALECLGINPNETEFEWTWDQVARALAAQKGEATWRDDRPVFPTSYKAA